MQNSGMREQHAAQTERRAEERVERQQADGQDDVGKDRRGEDQHLDRAAADVALHPDGEQGAEHGRHDRRPDGDDQRCCAGPRASRSLRASSPYHFVVKPPHDVGRPERLNDSTTSTAIGRKRKP